MSSTRQRLHQQRPESSRNHKLRMIAVLALAVITAVLVIQALQTT